MLISMPTGTSTIFGVFQLIRVSPKQCWHDVRAGIKTRLTSNIAQARNIRCRRHTDASDTGNFPLGQSHFALGQGERTRATDRRTRRFGSGFANSVRLPKPSVAGGDFGRDVGEPVEAPTIRHRLSFAPQQSLSAVLLSALAPSDRCAAVGSPCICRCVSCEDAATSPVARFMVPVGGC